MDFEITNLTHPGVTLRDLISLDDRVKIPQGTVLVYVPVGTKIFFESLEDWYSYLPSREIKVTPGTTLRVKGSSFRTWAFYAHLCQLPTEEELLWYEQQNIV